jgi:hypothetical protein
MQGKSAQQMSVTYSVNNVASGPAASYFLSTQVDVVDASGATPTWTDMKGIKRDVGGYIGMQPYSNLETPAVVFSMFGPGIVGTYPDGTRCGGDADGDSGASCLKRITYSANTTYSLQIKHTGGGVLQGFSNGTLIGTIQVPNAAGLGNYVVQWLEPYGGAISCEAAPHFNATLSIPAFSPAISLAQSVSYRTGHCFNTNVVSSGGGSSHTFEIGTPQSYLDVSLKVKSTGALLRAQSTSQGCGGGALVTSATRYDDCARITEVDLGNGNVLLQTENGLRARCSQGSVLADQRNITASWTKQLGSDGFYSYKGGNYYLGLVNGALTCSATTQGDAQRFFRTATEPAGVYNLRNAWLNTYLVDRSQGRVYYGDDDPASLSTQWILEPWSKEQQRIKNRQTGLYMNNEGVPADAAGNHIVAMSAADPGWYSGAWTLEPVTGTSYQRIQSFWQAGEYINVEKQLGYAELSVPQPGWLSAQWALEPPVPAENKALLATTVTGSTQAQDQGFAKARDGVVSGYPVDSTKEWASVGESSGAYIQYAWPTAQTLSWVSLSDRINSNDRVLSGRLTFSDGSTVDVGALADDGTAVIVKFSKRAVTSVRFTVTSVSATTQNIGLAEMEAH